MARSKMTQAQVVEEMAERLETTPKEVKRFFGEMLEITKQELFSDCCPGEIAFPIGLKIKRVDKPATKERPGRNPITGETVMIKAKPAKTVVKAVAMKKLKIIGEE